MKEIFKKHKSGYLVSNLGRIKGVRVSYLTPTLGTNGYLVTSLPTEKGRFFASVHRVVYETFLGAIPKGKVINHLDGDKLNNSIDNLELCSVSQNTQHAYDTGLAKGKPGETNSQAKLTAEQFLLLCEALMEGATNEEVANLFNLNSGYVSLIRHKKRWTTLFPEWYVPSKSLGNTGIPLPTMIQVYEDTLKPYKNSVIASKWGLDRSTVSRIRAGKTWVDFISYYNKNITELQRPSEASEYTQVGGNIENPY